MSQTIMKTEERVAFALRALYKQYGYLPYKMSKFEAYDLYVANKDFLVSDGIITFNDTDGKLLALKPDVTLSIIKNVGDGVRKVFYHENVYRISGATKQFKEWMQVGLERVGDTSVYALYETVYLAAASLKEIFPSFVLDVSHLGILSAVLADLGVSVRAQNTIMKKIAEKNLHETAALCQEYGVPQEKMQTLLTLVKTYGKPNEVLEKIKPLVSGVAKSAFEELQAVCNLLTTTQFADKIRLDFSVINDMKYYSGIVFKGFVEGVAEGVLSGGQYDGLMQRMGKKTGAIGFAVYLDLLENMHASKANTDVDVLVLYDANTPLTLLQTTVQQAVESGKSVSAQTQASGVRCGELIDLRKGD